MNNKNNNNPEIYMQIENMFNGNEIMILWMTILYFSWFDKDRNYSMINTTQMEETRQQQKRRMTKDSCSEIVLSVRFILLLNIHVCLRSL